MSKPSPAILNLARQLLAGEKLRVDSSHGDADPAVQACEKLRLPLTKLAGVAGYSSLMSRALTLAKRQAPSLERLRVGADGSLIVSNGVPKVSDTAGPAAPAAVVLVAEMLNLLVTLIGEPLTLSLVRESWTGAAEDAFTGSTEETS